MTDHKEKDPVPVSVKVYACTTPVMAHENPNSFGAFLSVQYSDGTVTNFPIPRITGFELDPVKPGEEITAKISLFVDGLSLPPMGKAPAGPENGPEADAGGEGEKPAQKRAKAH